MCNSIGFALKNHGGTVHHKSYNLFVSYVFSEVYQF